jgi:hypothetical protein
MNSETEAGILSKPVSAAVIASTSSNNESDSPTTSGFISPQQFRGYPKVRFVSICLLILKCYFFSLFNTLHLNGFDEEFANDEMSNI